VTGADPCACGGYAAAQIDHAQAVIRSRGTDRPNSTTAWGSCNASKRANPLPLFLLRQLR
jgi:hypothetical protein